MDATKTYEGRVEIDPETGDHMLTFPPELLAELGWGPGDTVRFELADDGAVRVSRVA